MRYTMVFSGTHFITLFLSICFLAALAFFLVLIAKALQKYIKSSDIQKEKALIKRSLGEQIKDNRMKCKMTQEFVAENLGVSRQAVSKWESGSTDPITSNLIALANLFKITVEELIGNVNK